jgi:hypothetical protein
VFLRHWLVRHAPRFSVCSGLVAHGSLALFVCGHLRLGSSCVRTPPPSPCCGVFRAEKKRVREEADGGTKAVAAQLPCGDAPTDSESRSLWSECLLPALQARQFFTAHWERESLRLPKVFSPAQVSRASVMVACFLLSCLSSSSSSFERLCLRPPPLQLLCMCAELIPSERARQALLQGMGGLLVSCVLVPTLLTL